MAREVQGGLLSAYEYRPYDKGFFLLYSTFYFMKELLMRTNVEILNRIASEAELDFFGVVTADLVACLSYKDAKPFLKKGIKKSEWKDPPLEEAGCDKIVKDRLLDYLPFALNKCVDHRGLSASRSMDHIRTWLWLLKDEEALAYASDGDHYPMYGAPILKYVCERYGVDYRSCLDSEVELEGFENMAQGRCCGMSDGCGCGC